MHPFEADPESLADNLEGYVNEVFSALESEFLTMPRGTGFLTFANFEAAYEILKRITASFKTFEEARIYDAILATPVGAIVLRSMLGFTPSEWAYLTEQETGEPITQGFARTLDRDIRNTPERPLQPSPLKEKRIRAMIATACRHLNDGAPETPEEILHWLDKADTKEGVASLRRAADIGIPYAMLLYERFLGRPFASHRDSVSELVGDVLELVIEKELSKAGISFRKTGRAERIPGFDQAPDFVIPSEYNPQVVIEAKLTEDDGTARDKVTRIQHLRSLSDRKAAEEGHGFEVIACIGGRGFKVRREDMKKMLLATQGKVFTTRTMTHLVTHTRLRGFTSG